MTHVGNYHFYSTDLELLKRLKEEYEFMGKKAKIENGGITVYATNPKPVKKKVDKKQSR